jgi:hypothetical protein
MASSLSVSRSRTYPVERDEAFAKTLPLPLPDLFARRYGPLPPITSVDQEGEWATAGQIRTIHTGDGGSMREELLDVDPPHSFSYELTEVSGPMKALARSVDGRWSFDPVGTGCRITWSWTIHPANAAGGLALPVFGRMWRGYAGRALDRLEDLLLA